MFCVPVVHESLVQCSQTYVQYNVCCFVSCVELYTHCLYSTNACICFQVMFKIEEDVEAIRESVRIGLCADICLSMYFGICIGACASTFVQKICKGMRAMVFHTRSATVHQSTTPMPVHAIFCCRPPPHTTARRVMLLHAAARYCKHLQVDQLQESASAVSRKKSASKESKRVATMYKIQEDRCNACGHETCTCSFLIVWL